MTDIHSCHPNCDRPECVAEREGSKPEPKEHTPGCDALGGYGHGVGPCTCAPEPQAQAVEPVKGYLHLKPPFEDENGNDISGEYITLQSHLKVVAEQHEIEHQLSGQLEAAAEAIAKKDAALDACVEVLERIGKEDSKRNFLTSGESYEFDAAITQAQEARK